MKGISVRGFTLMDTALVAKYCIWDLEDTKKYIYHWAENIFKINIQTPGTSGARV